MRTKSLIIIGLILVAAAIIGGILWYRGETRSSSSLPPLVNGIREGNMTTSDNVRLHYWFYDRGTSVVTLFFHGGVRGDSSQFRMMGAEAYTDRFGSLLVFDERGCGKSQLDVPPDTINPDRLIRDTNELRSAVIPDNSVVVMGRSFGGFLATLYGTSRPKNVLGYILVAPGHFDLAIDIRGGEMINPKINARILDEENAYLYEHYYSQLEPAAQIDISEEDGSGDSITDAYENNLHVETENHAPWLASLVGTPTLIVSGQYDVRVPPFAIDVMKKYIPDAQFVEIPDSGHYGQYTHEDEFFSAVQKLWDKL